MRVRIDADMAGRIAALSKSQDVPMSHLVRQALETAFGNGRGPGVPTPRAPSAKRSGAGSAGTGNGKPGVEGTGAAKAPLPEARGPASEHVHRWGKRSTVTALKKCLDCPAVQA